MATAMVELPRDVQASILVPNPSEIASQFCSILLEGRETKKIDILAVPGRVVHGRCSMFYVQIPHADTAPKAPKSNAKQLLAQDPGSGTAWGAAPKMDKMDNPSGSDRAVQRSMGWAKPTPLQRHPRSAASSLARHLSGFGGHDGDGGVVPRRLTGLGQLSSCTEEEFRCLAQVPTSEDLRYEERIISWSSTSSLMNWPMNWPMAPHDSIGVSSNTQGLVLSTGSCHGVIKTSWSDQQMAPRIPWLDEARLGNLHTEPHPLITSVYFRPTHATQRAGTPNPEVPHTESSTSLDSRRGSSNMKLGGTNFFWAVFFLVLFFSRLTLAPTLSSKPKSKRIEDFQPPHN
ncbi:hypothetical protein BGZ63DRAFT_459026 [Mariannaea sp. PMI_226]|nr:hypothetical protein BGZ63DRAFT_459026 [Mariannaea sp. PMI_226]